MSKSTLRFLKEREREISSAFKKMGQNFVFSVSGHRTRQRNNYETWREFGLASHDFKENVYVSFNGINHERRSLACVREQSRARLALVSYVFPVFKCLLLRSKVPVYFVTIVQPQHYRDIGRLKLIKARRIVRKFDDGMRGLRKDFPDAVGAAAIEIIAYEDREEYTQFHPHVHALIAGIPVEKLRKVFEPRKSSTQRSGAKPVVSKRLTSKHDIAHRLQYMTKFKMDLSYPHDGKFVHGSRSTREMPNKLKAEWLEWMSGVFISEVFCFSGILRAQVDKVYNVEMETVVRRFCKIGRNLSV